MDPVHRCSVKGSSGEYGPWQTVDEHFNRWRKDGTLDWLPKALRIRPDRNGTGLAVHRRQLGAPITGRCRGGATGAAGTAGPCVGPLTQRIRRQRRLVTDGSSLPLAVEVTAGRQYNSTCFERVMNTVRIRQRLGPRRWWPRPLARDRRYGFRWMRWWLRRQHVRAAIPQRSDQRARQRGRGVRFHRDRDRRRNVVERCVGWLKECRRIATRFEKLALNYLAMVKLAMIQRYLRILDSSDGA